MGAKRTRARKGHCRDNVAQRATAAASVKGRTPWKVPEIEALSHLIETRLYGLRATIRRNLAIVTVAVLHVARAVRSGYGRLSLSALARCLPTADDHKTRFKRLSRFLDNTYFCPEVMIPELVGLVIGRIRKTLVPVLVDQTDIGGTPTVMAGVPHKGRVLRIGFSCFEYATLRFSQNALETGFLQLIIASLGMSVRAVFTADRQYGRYQLIQALNRLGQLYILRCKTNVVLWQKGKKRFPRDFKAKWNTPIRYANLRYRKYGKEPIDLIVYRERQFKEVWYLLVPAGSERILSSEQVVKFYRSRMRIEQGVRDWKTHLGVRGLRLHKERAVRLGRLLLAFALAYICLLLLGSSSSAQAHRSRFEARRTKPQHGTCSTLSVLSLGMMFLASIDLIHHAQRELLSIINALARGTPACQLYATANLQL